jgi:hypothetical protein
MVDLNKIVGEAKELIDERGGVEGLKDDALELKDIAEGEGSLTDKAKAAAAALRDPGAPGDPAPEEAPPAA